MTVDADHTLLAEGDNGLRSLITFTSLEVEGSEDSISLQLLELFPALRFYEAKNQIWTQKRKVVNSWGPRGAEDD